MNSKNLSNSTKPAAFAYAGLAAVFSRKISRGKYYVKIGQHEYNIINHGYFHPDKCVWWEAVNLKTNEADFHEHTKKAILRNMINVLSLNGC
jgi:hypothetical protein